MKPTNLDIKNLVAGALVIISSYAVPEVDSYLRVKSVIFIFGVVFSISTVFFSKIKTTKGKTFNIYRYNVEFPFFKIGLASVLAALLFAALSFSTFIIMLCVYTGIFSLTTSVIFERQNPVIFKAGDEVFAKRIVSFGYYLVGGTLISYFLYKILNIQVFFTFIYILGIAGLLVVFFLTAFILYRMLLIRY